jgi:hypothetical protein
LRGHGFELPQFQKVGPWRALSEPTKKEKQTRHTCQGPTVGDVWRKFKIAFPEDPRQKSGPNAIDCQKNRGSSSGRRLQ